MSRPLPLVLALLGGLALGACAPPPEAAAPGVSVAPLRPDTPGNRELFRYDPGDVVEVYDVPGDRFRIWYTRTGRHAVRDGAGEGVPADVLTVGARYADVARFYEDELGFRSPLRDDIVPDAHGGDGRFDVYLLDFGGVGDGRYAREACLPEAPSRCAGYMAQENDFAGYGYPSFDYAVRILASHEYFHAVQAAYDADQGSVLAEGTAVWATEQYDPSLSDFEGFIRGYLNNPDRPLDEPLPGPVDPFSYGAALVFQFLGERFGRELIPALWSRCEDGAAGEPDPYWIPALDALLREAYDSSLGEALVELAQWNLYTGAHADPALSYANGADYPPVKVENVTLPYADRRGRYFRMSSRYLRANVGGRAQLTVALVGAEARQGLRLFLAGRAGARQHPPVELPLDGSEAVAVEADWTTATVIVVNPRLEGESRRPGLCFGTPEEVAGCVAELGGEPPAEDAGPPSGPDQGPADHGPGPTDGGGAEAGPPASGRTDPGGCQAGGAPPASLALGLLLGGFALRRRRAAAAGRVSS